MHDLIGLCCIGTLHPAGCLCCGFLPILQSHNPTSLEPWLCLLRELQTAQTVCESLWAPGEGGQDQLLGQEVKWRTDWSLENG